MSKLEKLLIKCHCAKKVKRKVELRFWNPLLYIIVLLVALKNWGLLILYKFKWRWMITWEVTKLKREEKLNK